MKAENRDNSELQRWLGEAAVRMTAAGALRRTGPVALAVAVAALSLAVISKLGYSSDADRIIVFAPVAVFVGVFIFMYARNVLKSVSAAAVADEVLDAGGVVSAAYSVATAGDSRRSPFAGDVLVSAVRVREKNARIPVTMKPSFLTAAFLVVSAAGFIFAFSFRAQDADAEFLEGLASDLRETETSSPGLDGELSEIVNKLEKNPESAAEDLEKLAADLHDLLADEKLRRAFFEEIMKIDELRRYVKVGEDGVVEIDLGAMESDLGGPGGAGGEGGKKIARALDRAASAVPGDSDLVRRVSATAKLIRDGEIDDALDELRDIFASIPTREAIEALRTDVRKIEAAMAELAKYVKEKSDAERLGTSDGEELVHVGSHKGDGPGEDSDFKTGETQWKPEVIEARINRIEASRVWTADEKAVLFKYFDTTQGPR